MGLTGLLWETWTALMKGIHMLKKGRGRNWDSLGLWPVSHDCASTCPSPRWGPVPAYPALWHSSPLIGRLALPRRVSDCGGRSRLDPELHVSRAREGTCGGSRLGAFWNSDWSAMPGLPQHMPQSALGATLAPLAPALLPSGMKVTTLGEGRAHA